MFLKSIVLSSYIENTVLLTDDVFGKECSVFMQKLLLKHLYVYSEKFNFFFLGVESLFLFKNNKVYEVIKFKETYSSWFIDESVQKGTV